MLSETTVIGSFLFVFGACVGSFLNVCIVRWPHEKSVVKPRSHCPKCQKPIAWSDNIPLFSYIFLGAKSRCCHQRIPFRYFFVELLTACAFVGFYLYYGLDIILIPYLFMLSCFIVATFVDFEHRLIPDEVSVGGMVCGLIFAALIPSMFTVDQQAVEVGRLIMRIITTLVLLDCLVSVIRYKKNPPKNEDGEEEEYIDFWLLGIICAATIFDWLVENKLGVIQQSGLKSIVPHVVSLDIAVIGFMVGGGSIYAMGVLGDFLFKKESMGGGDVKLMAMVGAFMGWKLAILSFFIAPFFGAIYGIYEKIRTKDTVIAYGPFLVLGSLISLFWGELIIHWIINGYRF
ncbi:MAG: prepilin peptidase [Candidatus Omnitrophica bacterium]|nr:prepilin peptidase [Candidatus Omnitrophota bacterium]